MKPRKLSNSPVTYFISGTQHAQWVLFIHAAFVNHNMFQSQFRSVYKELHADRETGC